MIDSLRTETRVLLLLNKTELSQPDVDQVCDLCRLGIDWRALYGRGLATGITPLILRNLAACNISTIGVPSAVFSALRISAFNCRTAKEIRARDTLALLKLLNRSGVDAMLIKGAVIESFVHQEDWYTLPGDVDMLVRARDRHARIDWQHIETVMGRLSTAFECEARHHDLHLDHVLRIDFETVWRDAVPVNFRGSPVLIPSPEDTLIFACVTSYRKALFHLRRVFEIREIMLRYRSLDWAAVGSKAQRYRCSAVVYAALYAARLLGVPSPDAAWKAVCLGRIRGWLIRRFVQLLAPLMLLDEKDPVSRLRRNCVWVALSYTLHSPRALKAHTLWLLSQYGLRNSPSFRRSVVRPSN